MTFAAAFTGVLIYFIALLTSHLAAFRVEVGMRKQGMTKMMDMPLGFLMNILVGKYERLLMIKHQRPIRFWPINFRIWREALSLRLF